MIVRSKRRAIRGIDDGLALAALPLPTDSTRRNGSLLTALLGYLVIFGLLGLFLGGLVVAIEAIGKRRSCPI
jgi:hypothetical protein